MPIPVRISPFLCRGCPPQIYAVLASLSEGCTPDRGRLHTCYSPVRHSPAERASSFPAAVRLACVKPAASVHPEPGSNSPLLVIYLYIYLQSFVCPGLSFSDGIVLTETPDSPCSLVSAFQCLRRGIRCLSCGIMSLFSFASQPSSLRRAFIAVPSSFPDCGCKITAFFAPVQIFLQPFCNFSNFNAVTF